MYLCFSVGHTNDLKMAMAAPGDNHPVDDLDNRLFLGRQGLLFLIPSFLGVTAGLIILRITRVALLVCLNLVCRIGVSDLFLNLVRPPTPIMDLMPKSVTNSPKSKH